MKKSIALLLAVLIITVSIPFAGAAGQVSGNFRYINNGDGTCTIESFLDPKAESVVIPEKIGKLTVTKIGTRAFTLKSQLEMVSFPETVESIG
jgi:catabolite regulation protein CreA